MHTHDIDPVALIAVVSALTFAVANVMIRLMSDTEPPNRIMFYYHAGGTVVFLVAFTEYFLVFLIGGGAVPSYAGYLFPMLLSSDRPVAALLTLIFLCIPLLLFVGLEFLVVRMYRKKGLM